LDVLRLRQRLESELSQQDSRYHLKNLDAHSPAMKQLLEQVRGVAESPRSSVMLLGETGTGKEFLAHVIHHNGPRSSGPFIGVNCTAIPKELFESELFGFERGAFTGANQRKLGLFEKAEGGTLFLDEIGDLDHSMQAKLLRVIQERSFRRLGATDDLGVDFRLITATNRELKKEVKRGAFREDLYFRLNVVAFEIPPLRKRLQDILPLCQRSIVRFAQEFSKPIPDIDPAARAMLERYQYPGNVRELQNIIERAMIFCQGRTLTPTCLPIELRESAPYVAAVSGTGTDSMVRIDMRLGQQTLAAKHLGLTRFSLDRRLKKIADS
jgi:two-component system response regulator AtoC